MTARTSLTPGVEGRQLDELPLGGQRDDVRERGLAGAGRAVEHQRHRLVGLHQPAQRRALAEQVLLADDLVERARPHADGERRTRVDRRRARRPRARRTAKSRLRSYPRGTTASVQQRRIGRHVDRQRDRAGRDAPVDEGAPALARRRPRPWCTRRWTPGVTLIDTADAYARDEAEFGHNETLVANALRSLRRAADVPRGDQGRPHPAGHATGSWTGRRPTCAARARPRCAGWASTRSGSTSSTGPTRRRRGRSRWGRCGRSPTTAWCGWSASRTPTSPRSTRPGRSSATRWSSVQNQFSPGYRSSADELAHCAAVGLAWLPWSPFGGVSAAGSLDAEAPGLRRGGRRARGVGLPGHAGLAPRAGRRRPADPGRLPAGVDHRLRRRRRPGALPRPARPPERRLTLAARGERAVVVAATRGHAVGAITKCGLRCPQARRCVHRWHGDRCSARRARPSGGGMRSCPRLHALGGGAPPELDPRDSSVRRRPSSSRGLYLSPAWT